MMQKLVTRLFLFYHKFQTVILGFVVLGLLELLAYSDLIVSLFVLPEFVAPVLLILIGIGLYKWFRGRKR
ncbi:MAG: hypothetical protein K0Q59_3507 [Paenibacillus sp.]|nr:hypothetical protein [Paenibacillus sp.]